MSKCHRRLQDLLLLRNPRLVREHPFRNILRLADLYWPEENIAFEIQLSPLPASEVEKRAADYAQQGIHLVWLLSDKFAQGRSIPAWQETVRRQPHYYISRQTGAISDRFEILQNRRRVFSGPLLPVDLSLLRPAPDPGFLGLSRPFCFSGDLLDRARNCPAYAKELEELDLSWPQQAFARFSFVEKYFYMLLEFILRRFES